MTWLLIIIGIVVVVFIYSLVIGNTTDEALGAAAGAGMYAGGCIIQIFFAAIGIIVILMLFGWLF